MPSPLLDLAPYLSANRVLRFAAGTSKRSALIDLAELTTADFPAQERAAFFKAIFDREDVASTGIGRGVAIPHARLIGIDACRISLGLAAGIDFGSRDGAPVQIIAMLVSRERDHAEHLRILATVAMRLDQAERRAGLL